MFLFAFQYRNMSKMPINMDPMRLKEKLHRFWKLETLKNFMLHTLINLKQFNVS
jgi:hypothetical protein